MDYLVKILDELRRRVNYYAWRFRTDRCTDNAAALTYMSLFALVPLLTVMYTMASAIPAFQGMETQLQELLFKHLMPETSSEIEGYLGEFSRQAKNLTGAGIVFLVVTAILMLRNIEKAFNMIWRARKNRSPVSSFLLYWAVLTLAPITIGMALAISTYLNSFVDVVDKYDFLGARVHLLQAAPLLLNMAGFTLLYAAVPNCRVPFKHTLIGGFVTAIIFNLARSVFTDLVVGSNYTFIYGAFAAVPLFLLWLYISWTIILMGGILVHSLSAYQSVEQASRPTLLKALDILYVFWKKQQAGKTVREIELLDGRHQVTRKLDSESWRELRDLFIDKNILTQNDRGQYLLRRDLHQISFWQLKEWVGEEQSLNEEDIAAGLDWQRDAWSLLRQQRIQQRDLLDMDLVTLFEK